MYASGVPRTAVLYATSYGIEPYTDYIESLRDRRAAAKIKVRVSRAEMGNLGDHRSVGQGVIELKVDYGPGYRIYVGLQGNEVIVLLCAGDKSTQHQDIEKARTYWQEFRRNS